MISITNATFNAAKGNVFYRAFNMFPGNILLDKWQESRKIAVEDVKARYEKETPELCDQLIKEMYNISDAGSWMRFIVKKYMQSFEGSV